MENKKSFKDKMSQMTDGVATATKKAGFTNVKTYGDFTFEAPKEDSERIFFVCKK